MAQHDAPYLRFWSNLFLMGQPWRVVNLVVLGFLVTISFLGTFVVHISFGRGLGDLFGMAILYVITLLHSMFTFAARKEKNQRGHILLAIIFLPLSIYISLKATLWRGQEYPWNGSIFYLPCAHEVPIENESERKKILVSMCTGQHSSRFSGVWDGKKIKVESGEVKIPNELEKYVRMPIANVNIIGNATILKVEATYSVTGVIASVNDSVPVISIETIKDLSETIKIKIPKARDIKPRTNNAR